MNTLIALLRGINVGGRNPLPMKDLVTALEECGARGVKTYIQSGNAVFHSTKKDPAGLSHEISAAIEKRSGFKPQVLILAVQDLQKAIADNPFSEAEAEPKSLHLGFLESVPKDPDLGALEKLRGKKERFQLIDAVFYLHAPDGVARSKLAARAEKLLGAAMTVRNWRTVGKILELADD